jgi:hypothetical protein
MSIADYIKSFLLITDYIGNRNDQNPTLQCKKRFTVFPSPDGISLTKLPLAGNNLIIIIV